MDKFDAIRSYASGKLPPNPKEYPMEAALVDLINDLFKTEPEKEAFMNAFAKFNNALDAAQIDLVTDLFGALKMK